MEPPEIKLSVALVTRNRPTSLERTLKSLRAQEVQPWEVIVSDDSDMGDAAAVKEIAAHYECRYLEGPKRGLYANRNHVATACRGTHIRTMDDDHEFPPGHVEACLTAVKSDPMLIWIISDYLPNDSRSKEPPYCPGQLHPRGYSMPPTDDQNCWAIADGATIYPKVIFDKGVRFAEDFVFGGAYLELGSMLHWLGYHIRHLTTTYVIHYHDLSARSFMDMRINLSSCTFAMLCHSFIYQPTPINKTLTLFELAKQIIRHRFLAVFSIREALNSFLARRIFLKQLVSRCEPTNFSAML